ncbi:MAG TPA: hypothetical protein DER60_06705 [Syntrophomonas sp.]|jgi:uncharacterized lipoprotein YehR (DUF1307 family)|nr:hypothetical protein [Syntrophomonas sp.]
MKKIIVGLLAFMLILSLAGCGAKEKMEEKAGEALAEKIIKEAGGGDVDIDGDKVVIKGEDGEQVTFGQTEWPTSDLAKSIPKFKGGKVVTVMEMNDSLIIALEEASKEDFTDYLGEIKQTFTEQSYDMKSEGNVTYGAENGEGIGVSLIYTTDQTLSITVAKIPQ